MSQIFMGIAKLLAVYWAFNLNGVSGGIIHRRAAIAPKPKFDVLSWLGQPNGLINSIISDAIAKGNLEKAGKTNNTEKPTISFSNDDPSQTVKQSGTHVISTPRPVSLNDFSKMTNTLFDSIAKANEEGRFPTLPELGVPQSVTTQLGDAFDKLAATGFFENIKLLGDVISHEGFGGLMDLLNSPTIRASAFGPLLAPANAPVQIITNTSTTGQPSATPAAQPPPPSIDFSKDYYDDSDYFAARLQTDSAGTVSRTPVNTGHKESSIDIKRLVDVLEQDPHLRQELIEELQARGSTSTLSRRV